VYGECTVLNI